MLLVFEAPSVPHIIYFMQIFKASLGSFHISFRYRYHLPQSPPTICRPRCMFMLTADRLTPGALTLNQNRGDSSALESATYARSAYNDHGNRTQFRCKQTFGVRDKTHTALQRITLTVIRRYNLDSTWFSNLFVYSSVLLRLRTAQSRSIRPFAAGPYCQPKTWWCLLKWYSKKLIWNYNNIVNNILNNELFLLLYLHVIH